MQSIGNIDFRKENWLENQAQILAVMTGCLVLLILWGIYQGRKVKNDADCLMAGRSLPGWAAAVVAGMIFPPAAKTEECK